MANQKQLDILKKGVDGWNKWQEKNQRNIMLDLVGADLSKADLSKADLIGAALMKAKLKGADLHRADLSGANLSRARLLGTNLSGAKVNGAKLRRVEIGYTVLSRIDLRPTLELEETDFSGPSTIGTDALQMSQGQIPEAFLRGCGLSDWEIEAAKLYDPGLSNQEINDIQYRVYDLRATRAFQISPLFVSYRAIRQNPTVLLVLSKDSLCSDWVEHEVRMARNTEKEFNRDVLCPVALDDSWKSARWPERLMEQIMENNILDFSTWRDEGEFDNMFRKLLDGLELFYKG